MVSSAFRAYFRATDGLLAETQKKRCARSSRPSAIVPDDENVRFVHAGALVFTGAVDAGRAEMQQLIVRRPSWETILRGFESKGLLPLPPDVDLEGFLHE